jgi:hypothetical protein
MSDGIQGTQGAVEGKSKGAECYQSQEDSSLSSAPRLPHRHFKVFRPQFSALSAAQANPKDKPENRSLSLAMAGHSPVKANTPIPRKPRQAIDQVEIISQKHQDVPMHTQSLALATRPTSRYMPTDRPAAELRLKSRARNEAAGDNSSVPLSHPRIILRI